MYYAAYLRTIIAETRRFVAHVMAVPSLPGTVSCVMFGMGSRGDFMIAPKNRLDNDIIGPLKGRMNYNSGTPDARWKLGVSRTTAGRLEMRLFVEFLENQAMPIT
ncbi:hypothetical protein CFIMG_003180RAa [Ceratocystis fimbriata CBS 114723]|uniref:Uncharacterized protein n=1 Tax=Ceratocystis fimbriata CBS 114723 TaxID=1035309 RepID=A0A2C5WXI2_9PEZI|nr:hypothetical protein CFIMG_003180RAa [Ceratocystis fimbriata CBS 114723]